MGRLRRLPGAAAGVEGAQGGTRSRGRCRRSRGDERAPGRAAGDVTVEIDARGWCQSLVLFRVFPPLRHTSAKRPPASSCRAGPPAPSRVGSFANGEWDWEKIRYANNGGARRGGNRAACGRGSAVALPPKNTEEILDQFDAFFDFLPALQEFLLKVQTTH